MLSWILDALFIARLKNNRYKTHTGVISFKISSTDYSTFKIQEIIPGQSGDPLEWSNFVRLCRRDYVRYPHILRRDALQGPMCNNAEKILHRNENPHIKTVGDRTPMQVCVKSTAMAGKLESSIFAVYVIRAP